MNKRTFIIKDSIAYKEFEHEMESFTLDAEIIQAQFNALEPKEKLEYTSDKGRYILNLMKDAIWRLDAMFGILEIDYIHRLSTDKD